MKISLATAAGIVLLIGVSCKREPESNIQDLPGWKDKAIQAIIAEFGKPEEEHTYTIAQAPTKGWNHAIIFSAYPKDAPENRDVVIKEYGWDRDNFEIRACCHLIGKQWFVMGVRKIRKDVRF